MTIRNKKGYWVLLLLLISQGILLGQISISNLMEYQRGNLPHTDPKSLSTLYDQVNVNYHINMFLRKLKLLRVQINQSRMLNLFRKESALNIKTWLLQLVTIIISLEEDCFYVLMKYQGQY